MWSVRRLEFSLWETCGDLFCVRQWSISARVRSVPTNVPKASEFNVEKICKNGNCESLRKIARKVRFERLLHVAFQARLTLQGLLRLRPELPQPLLVRSVELEEILLMEGG